MKLIYFFLGFYFLLNNSFGQSKNTSDTLRNNISVMFNKVKNSYNWSTKAELKVKYVPSNNNVLLFFELLNNDFRFKTTLNDYAILKFDENELRLQNKVEAINNERGHHIFVFELSKEKWNLFIKKHLKSVIFYFAPNEEFIVKTMSTRKGFDSELRRYYGELAKKTVTTTISKPDKKALNEMKLWLQKL